MMDSGARDGRRTGALSGLRVLDATQMLAGPLAAMRLGDLGADVVKVEAPGTGEFNRTHGFDDVRLDGEMSTFVALNRNKRSLALNLKDPEGLAVLRDLVAQSDVFIHNFRGSTARRLGIDYASLQDVNPALVYCSISGYGADGPYRNRPGQDLVLQGYSGSMWSTGKKGDPPSPSALWAADVMTGYQAAIGILAALQERSTSGTGQHVEVDMLSVVLDCQLQELVTYLNSGTQPERSNEVSAHGSIPAPYGVYETIDGWITLAMCPLPALGRVLQDEWLQTLTNYNDGSVFRDQVYAKVRPIFATRTTAEWLELLDAENLWAGPVYTYEDVSRDPHVRQQGLITQQEHRGGTIETINVPIKMSRSQVGITRGAPVLGEHSGEVLAEVAGYGPEQIERLAAAGVITAPVPQSEPAA